MSSYCANAIILFLHGSDVGSNTFHVGFDCADNARRQRRFWEKLLHEIAHIRETGFIRTWNCGVWNSTLVHGNTKEESGYDEQVIQAVYSRSTPRIWVVLLVFQLSVE
jgi:hypothetical protein